MDLDTKKSKTEKSDPKLNHISLIVQSLMIVVKQLGYNWSGNFGRQVFALQWICFLEFWNEFQQKLYILLKQK